MLDLKNKIYTFSNTNPLIKPLKKTFAKHYYRFVFDILKQYNDKKIYQVYGMQRTGNHAIISWLKQNLKGSVLFCNNVGTNQFPKHSVIKRFKLKTGKPTIIASHEDFLSKNIFSGFPYEKYGKHIQGYNVLIIRDPFNLFASRYTWNFPQGKKFRENINYRNSVIQLWKDNAKLYIQWEKSATTANNIAINYNLWCTSPNYKDELAKKLDIQNLKPDVNNIPNFGGGSSFNGIKNQKEVKNVTQRFNQLLNNENFVSIFKDKEIVELSNQIFGEINGTDKILENTSNVES